MNFWAIINGFNRIEDSPVHLVGLANTLAGLLVCAVLLMGNATTAHAETAVVDPYAFDHVVTGFPLTGYHTQIECEECHLGGTYEALPTVCSACHDNVLAKGIPPEHINTALSCDACHNTQSFLVSAKKEIDHSLFGQPCFTCHNGFNAQGKGINHIASSNLCEACHVNHGWIPVSSVDHSQVRGSCYSCHNGVQATGKSSAHIPTTNVCESCHEVDAGITWKTTLIDHSQAIGPCSGCHDGVSATGKGQKHIPTTQECNNCHTTVNWLAAAAAYKRFIA